MTWFCRLVSVVSLAGAAWLSGGCAPGSSGEEPADGGEGAADGGDGDGSGGGAGTTGTGPTLDASLGIVVIDIQETFVDGASNADMAAIVDRSKALFTLADEAAVPFFITFEASQTGDHALHAPLQPELPSQAQDFTKTTFAATGLPSFASAVTGSGVSHVVVIGAETDVCVLQTVLGLRAMGLTVLLQSDAVFSEETNTSPALRRMEQAGVAMANASDVAGFVSDPSTLPAGQDTAVRIVRPLEMGVVLNDFSNAAFTSNGDAQKSAKVARLRELLLVSEWFELPVYVADVGAGLPAELADYYWGKLRPIEQIGADVSVTQLVFAGTDGQIAGSISPWIGTRDLFVMEDALLAQGTAGEQAEVLAPLFAGGLVPTTYKTFYYDMTKSVDLAEWPSQAWVDRFDEYYDITQAPEDLPPLGN